MTKCKVIFDQPKQGKPIEFVKCIDTANKIIEAELKPSEWDNIELIAKDCISDLDVMFAFDDTGREGGIIYLGHWNDGYAE